MTKKELAEILAEKENVPKSKAAKFIDTLIEEIRSNLSRGNNVILSGLGKFVVVEKKARKARNPKTGEIVDVPAKKIAKFRPAKELKELIR